MLNFIATDNVGVQSTSSVTIKVVAEPAPVFVAPTPVYNSSRLILTGVPFQDQIVAQSSLGSNVKIAFATIPSGATLTPAIPTAGANPATTVLNWTPTPANWGLHNLNFQAVISNIPSIFTQHNYQLEVNTPPAFSSTPPANLSVLAGQVFTYNITANDPDIPFGDQLDFIAAVKPAWLTLTKTSPTTAVLTGTPTAADAGSHTVHLELEDIYHHGNPTHVEQEFAVTVLAGVAPSIVVPANIISCDPVVTFAASETVGIPASTITYSIAPGSTFPVGTTTVTATATNAVGTSTNTFTVTVNKPIADITASGTTTICAGTSVTLTASSGASYLWSNGATTQSITVSTPGSYTVDVTNASGCTTTSAATTVANVVGVDSDGDGVPDACDADDDNDGILDIVECNKSNFYWSNPPTVNGNTATGVINGVNYTYTSTRPVETTSSVYAHNVFPSSFGIPNIKSIKNISISNNTLTFASPVTNPVLVFSSIGQPNLYVPIEFSAPIEILWSTAVVKNSSTKITGNEGYAVIRLNGTFSSISFNYLADENWVNFLFGADFQTCGDTDGDGIPDKLDTDSDNDGCPDAIEGSQNPTLAQTLNGRLTGGIDASGIPTLVNGGQGIGTSQNANLNCFCQAGIDKTAPVITCVTNIEINASSASGAVVNYITPTATDDCAVTITRTAGLASGSVFPIGTTIITHTATDAAGNISSCSFTVTVLRVPPEIVVPSTITANAPSNACGVAVEFAATETKAIPASIITYAVNGQPVVSGATFPVGTTTVTATATNAVGSDTKTFDIVVADVTPPTIAATSNINAIATSAAGAVVSYTLPTATDNCSGVISVTASPASGSVFPIGTSTVTVVAADAAGNSSSSSFTVTVVGVAPSIVVPTTIRVDASTANCGAVVNFAASEITGIPASTITYSHQPGSAFSLGTTIVTATATNAVGTSSATFEVVVTDNTAPVITTPAAQVFCENTAGTYTLQDVSATDNCGIATVSFAITGATTRSGSGYDAGTAFAVGTSTITYTVTDVNGNVSTKTLVVTVNKAPTATISTSNPDAFCNKLTVIGNSTSPINGYAWTYNNNPFAGTQAISLDNTNGDGTYSLLVTDNKGCTSLAAVTYQYSKQNTISNYTILAYKEAELKEYNTVQTGSVGVMSKKGEAEIGKNSSVAAPGAFVKAPKIEVKQGATVPIRLVGVASVALPTMQYNSANTSSLPNYTTNAGTTISLSGNYKNLKIRKGSNVTLSGTTFGNIDIEEGSVVRFTSTVINVEQLKVGKGPDNGLTQVRFANNTSVRVSKHVQIDEDCFINPDANQVTFYLGRQSNHDCNKHKNNDSDDDDHDRGHGDGDQKFEVKGGNTTVIANIYAPTGDIKVKGGEGCHKNHINTTVRMTGLFIGYEVEGEGKNVIWNNYACGSSSPIAAADAQPVYNKTSEPVEVADDLKVTVMPNPSTTYFTLKLASKSELPVNIKVVDAAGRVIDAKAKQPANSTMQMGQSYVPGSYFAEFIQGNQRKVVQLIKLK